MQIIDDEGRVRVNRAAMARTQVIVNDDLHIALDEQLHDMTADVTGAAGHQNFHRRSSPFGKRL